MFAVERDAMNWYSGVGTGIWVLQIGSGSSEPGDDSGILVETLLLSCGKMKPMGHAPLATGSGSQEQISLEFTGVR